MGPPVVNYYESVAVCLRVFLKQVKPNQPTMSVDAAEIKRICDIYDWHGKGELDMYYFMDIFYALCKPHQEDHRQIRSNRRLREEILQVRRGCLPCPTSCQGARSHRKLHDYIELCKLYDKNENGTM